MADYKIELGVSLNTKELRTQLNGLTDNTHRIRVDIDNSRLLKQIEHAKKELKELNNINGNKPSLNVNTESLEKSLSRVVDVIEEVKRSLGTLDDKSGMNSLISSVNQIATALGKVEDESDNLLKSLNALSKKDFIINFDIKTGKSASQISSEQGDAKRDAISQLKQQAKALEDYLDQYYQVSQKQEGVVKLTQGTNLFSAFWEMSPNIGNTKLSLKQQVSTLKQYIDLMQEAAKIKGIDLSSVTSGFSKTTDDIVKETNNIASGADQAKQALKGIFGGNINGDNLTSQLDSIVKDLGEIKTVIQGLSSGISLDGLTQSFNKLSSSIELLVQNCTLAKNIIGNGFSNVGDSVGKGSSGVENLEQDLEQVTDAAKGASEAIKKIDIDVSDGNIDELTRALRNIKVDDSSIKEATTELSAMNVVATKVSSTLKDGNLVAFEIKGIQKTEEGLERIVTLQNTIGKGSTIKYGQAVSSDFEELKRLATDISRIRIDIFESDDVSDISRAAAELDSLTKQYDELFTKTKANLSGKELSQLDNFIGKGNSKALNEFNNELKEFIKLQKQIENTRFEIGKLEITGDNTNQIAELKRQLEELESTYDKLMQSFMKKVSVNADIIPEDALSKLDNGITEATTNANNRLEQFKAKWNDTRTELAKGIKTDIEFGNFEDEIDTMRSKFNSLSNANIELRTSVELVEQAYEDMLNAAKANTGDEVADRERLIQAEKEYADALEKTNNLIKQQARIDKANEYNDRLEDSIQSLKLDMVNWLQKNTKAAKEYGGEINKLIDSLDKLDEVGVKGARRQFNNLTKEADSKGLTGLKTWDKLIDKAKEYASYLSAAELFMYAEQALRSMFEQVKLIDSAMTELKKVTDETDASYERFLTNAASRAKEIGTTIDGLVSSTADFARLGYDFADAQGLAEVANIYAVVGDDIDSVETATQSLISTLTAFKDEANGLSDSDFALSIVDKMNEVSNNFAISSGGIGDALQRSASSMMAANNSLDETIALITAANTVVQDPDSVGRLMPTLKMAISVKLQRWTRPRK